MIERTTRVLRMQDEKKTIMIADPSEELAWVLSKILTYEGYAVQTLAAWEDVGADTSIFDQIDFLLVDYLWLRRQAPGMRADVARLFDEQRALLLTTVPLPNMRDARDFGFENILEKPFDVQTLVQKIDTVFARNNHA